jgi:SAM-dependent methyltransferase
MADHPPSVATVLLRPELAAWPLAVRTELQRRAGIIHSRATGRVLELDDPATRELVRRKGSTLEGDAGAAADGFFDVVISIAGLVEFADLAATIRGIDRLLQPDGELLFVEPVARPGWAGLLAASAGSLLGPIRHQHLGRDVPLAIRATSFTITDIERFTMPSSVWPLRSFVQGRAMRFPEVAR